MIIHQVAKIIEALMIARYSDHTRSHNGDLEVIYLTFMPAHAVSQQTEKEKIRKKVSKNITRERKAQKTIPCQTGCAHSR